MGSQEINVVVYCEAYSLSEMKSALTFLWYVGHLQLFSVTYPHRRVKRVPGLVDAVMFLSPWTCPGLCL